MANISKNEVITYSQLKKYILQKIKENCQNVDRFPTDLPDDLTPGKSTKIYSGGHSPQYIEISITDRDNIMKQVSSSKVQTQLDEFLASRGLVNKPNIPISSKAMLNLFNNISIFLSCRSRIYKSNATNKNVYVFYNDGEVEYDKAPFEFKTDDMSITDDVGTVMKSEARESVKSLITQINKTNKITAAEMTIRCVCSSSSSCSSSSCSSSCCSSSSSSFIVYMLI